MQPDEPFPLEAIPPRVRTVVLREFQGRRPTVKEIAQISDRRWLATPGAGPTALAKLRSITHRITHPPQQNDPGLPRLTDAELLKWLESLQKELRWIRRTVKAHLQAD